MFFFRSSFFLFDKGVGLSFKHAMITMPMLIISESVTSASKMEARQLCDALDEVPLLFMKIVVEP